MKFKINKKNLITAANRVQNIISDKILVFINMKAMGNKLYISAFDRIVASYSEFDCDVATEGEVAVPGKMFLEVIKQIYEETVNIEKLDNALIIHTGEREDFFIKLPIEEERKWKDPPEFNSKYSFEFKTYQLKYMIDQVQYCISADATKEYCSVAFFHKTQKGKYRLVGTDSVRLSYCELDSVIINEESLFSGVTLTKKTLTELNRVCSEGYEKVTLVISEDMSTLSVSFPSYKLFSKLSTVKYPNYESVLPSASYKYLKISREHLINSIKRVLLAADKSGILYMTFVDSALVLEARDIGISESRERIFIPDFHEVNQKLCFKGSSLIEILSVVNSDMISLNIQTEEEPMLIIPLEQPEGCKTLHYIMSIDEKR